MLNFHIICYCFIDVKTILLAAIS